MLSVFFRFYFLLSLCFGATNLFAQDNSAKDENEPIDLDMRKAMFFHGTIPVKNKLGMLIGTFEVNYLPGATNIMKDAKKHFEEALEDLSLYLETEKFWKKEVYDRCERGVRCGWEGICKEGFGALPEDYQSFKESFNSVSVSEFGGIGRKCLDAVKFGGKCLYRTGTSVAYLSAGLVYSIVAPAIAMTMPAVASILRATTCGTAYPMMKMVWHAGAWTLTQRYTKTPAKKDSMMVKWIPAEPELR